MSIALNLSITLNQYQHRSQATAIYPRHDGYNLAYPVLGLAGEAGEVANEMKKVLRNDNGVVTPERLEKIKGELGDVLWYMAAFATELGLDLGSIAVYNLEKLQKRKEDGELLTRSKRDKMVPTEVPTSEYEAHLAKMKPTRESEK